MWEQEDKLFLNVKIDRDGILGKIAKVNVLEEELRNTLSELKKMISVEEGSQPSAEDPRE